MERMPEFELKRAANLDEAVACSPPTRRPGCSPAAPTCCRTCAAASSTARVLVDLGAVHGLSDIALSGAGLRWVPA